MNELILQWVAHYGYITIFSLLMVGILGVPVPDETLIAYAGYLSFKGDLMLLPAFGAAFLGTACGITLSYSMGHIGGTYLIGKYGTYLHLTEDKIIKFRTWFGRFGKWVLLFSYFVPGIRHLMALTAGASKLAFPVFALFAFTGGFLWSLTFIAVGYYFGEEWGRMSQQLRHWFILGSSAVAIFLSAYILVIWIAHRKKAGLKDDAA
jgi:membrane protein DedA with SNARE-associated domain